MKFRFSKNLMLSTLLLLTFFSAKAESGMEEYFYESGKIKVVVVVASIVLVGLLAYAVMLDIRLKKLEDKNK